MGRLFRKYREMSFEQKTVLTTVLGLCFSAVFAGGKLVIGLLTDYNLCIIAVYTFAILLSKLECLLGVKSERLSFKTRNRLIAAFLLIASFLYTGSMCLILFIGRNAKDYGLIYVELIAFISFAELGFAIAGILRTKNRGHFYRDIKLINFCIALIAIMTTQTAILDFTGSANTDMYNACTGIGVGVFTALCAVYILVAPAISVTGREHNVFVLMDKEKNNLINTEGATVEVLLCRSRVYGSYVYRADVRGETIDGRILRGESLWKRMHLSLKILCIVLSEILLFVWLVGRLIFSFRSINLPGRLEKIMKNNGFDKEKA